TQSNVVPVVPNAALNQIARDFAADLQHRFDDLGQTVVDVYLTGSGLNMDQLLAQAGYESYSDGYVVDFIPIRIQGVNPPDIVNYLIQDSRNPEQRTVSSRMMAQGKQNFLPLGSPLYREAGIGYLFNPTSNRHYFVLIFAARPGVLPVVITQRTALNVIAERVSERDVIIRPHNENTHTTGDRINDRDVIGRVQRIRISEQPEEQTCPAGLAAGDGWQNYRIALPYTLSAGDGLKTIYVQMCDSAGRTLTTATQVILGGSAVTPSDDLSTPLVLAHMTQTAVAVSTQYAPLQPTVEAILTATASAPLPTPTPTTP
ncbi:MAG: hypothetical protein K8I60_11895, partial [Anaerolineae bacterium]|nr:hypothetical protein [Anaerolineae bacterium]